MSIKKRNVASNLMTLTSKSTLSSEDSNINIRYVRETSKVDELPVGFGFHEPGDWFEGGEYSELLTRLPEIFGLCCGTASEILAALISRAMPFEKFLGINSPF
jgi:hypothetical protein